MSLDAVNGALTGVPYCHQTTVNFGVGAMAINDERDVTGESPANGATVGPQSNLASLLDRFTVSISDPEAHTIGSFAETVQALHSEFAMLARHFEAVAEHSAFGERDEFGMDVIANTEPASPLDASAPGLEP